ncbi:DUF4197 domain-containing protein [uncultured Pseudodesulfovibrio sp.]|uniref:DUF4197 domain-containing protein n=1 Tax=uncultured Pseudodesulfovibrio sp. TaxID=2035858 RepID=UPI0029C769D6|nr:DUF4197 domain-containing protein [uncultured Pseudodesulfovibrio sp.]
MRLILHFPISFLLTATLFVLPGIAGWGDSLKSMGDTGSKAVGLPYTPTEADAGIREVLEMGTDYAVAELGKSGGFSANPVTAIPLPDMLSTMVGTSGLLSSFNTAAEESAAPIGGIFHQTIDSMDIGNPVSIISGSDTSITDFFEQTARPTLKDLARPVIEQNLNAAGLGSYTNAISAAQLMSNASGSPFDPVDYVTDRSLDAMFMYIGDQEKDLRSNGAASASELLKKLF